MTPRLPLVLSARDLPEAELSAARLDGELYCVDSGYCPVDELEQPHHRARALGVGLHERLIAEQLSAAWVWGAIPSPPPHHQFCAAIGSRVSRTSVPWRTVREVVVDASNIVDIDSVSVTSPIRTAVDILRFSTGWHELDRAAVTGLMALGAFTAEDCVGAMNARRNLPNKRRALSRLRQIASPN